MAQGNFDACLAITLRFEGGYVDHPADPGGATNMGITRRTLAGWRGRSVSKAEVEALTKAEAAAIYRKNYWDAVGGDSIPVGPDLCTFDDGVNSGPRAGLKRYAAARRKFSAPADIVRAMCAARRAFMQGLKTFKVFGRGWMSRVAQVEAAATRMVFVAQGKSGPVIAREMQTEAVKAGTTAAKKTTQAKTAGGASAPAGGGIAAAGWNWEGIAFGAVVFAVIAFIAFMAWRAAQAENARKEAFSEAANG